MSSRRITFLFLVLVAFMVPPAFGERNCSPLSPDKEFASGWRNAKPSQSQIDSRAKGHAYTVCGGLKKEMSIQEWQNKLKGLPYEDQVAYRSCQAKEIARWLERYEEQKQEYERCLSQQ